MILLNIISKLSLEDKKNIEKYYKLNLSNLKQNRQIRLNKKFKLNRLLKILNDIVNTKVKVKDIIKKHNINEQSFYREARTLKQKIKELQRNEIKRFIK